MAKKKASRKGTRSTKSSSTSREKRGEMGEQFARVTAPNQLSDPKLRREWGLPSNEHDRGPYIIELNLQHVGGLPEAENKFIELHKQAEEDVKANWAKLAPDQEWSSPPKPTRISKTYYRCELCVFEWRKLIALDENQARARAIAEKEAAEKEAAEKRAAKQAAKQAADWEGDRLEEKRDAKPARRQITIADEFAYRTIYRLWPDFPIKAHMDRSVATIKADAAQRAFAAAGDGITWAVIDSGIDADHLHFGSGSRHALRSGAVADLHRCFANYQERRGNVSVAHAPPEDPDADPNMPSAQRRQLIEEHRRAALVDDFGHGTHVAGVIAGSAPRKGEILALEREFRMDDSGENAVASYRSRAVPDRRRLSGVAPNCRLISLRVLDHRGEGRASNVIQALQYIRERLNDDPKLLRVHGVNLSVGYEFDAEMFACGQSPLCTEVDRLVQAGVVVVAAAGNTGYGTVGASQRPTKVGLSNTINDPGNAALAITVGATHRDSPHTYGVSYFSSKGPTGDGRLKPDLVAPGERITSCAAGVKLQEAMKRFTDHPDAEMAAEANGSCAYYVDDSGTSMAAPHVSGAIAAFLSIRREFIGRPLEVKRIFLENATSLQRERYFQGHGLVDLMRAIQAV